MGQRLGQHFLRDGRMADAIVQAGDLQPDDDVLEIGPGPGVLTGRIAARLANAPGTGTLRCIELDPALAAGIRAMNLPHTTVVDGDAMTADLGAPDVIISNLPYQISGPVTFRLLDLLATADKPWRRAVLMYQKEFADRLLAGPGSKTYGRLSVHGARQVAARRLRDVPPGAFSPPPKVRSTVVVLEPHTAAPFAVADETLWRRVVDGTFNQRRKKLRNTLPGCLPEALRPHAGDALDDLGFGDARPETLAPADFAALVARLAAEGAAA